MGTTLYLKDGKTLHFEEVEDFKIINHDKDFYLQFSYFGKTFQKRRIAVFNGNDLLGYVLDEGLEVERQILD